jgi:hypothetical protein
MSRRRRADDAAGLDGIITFFSSHHALHGEEVLKQKRIRAVLVPGPREISPNCGVALRFDWKDNRQVKLLFDENRIQYESLVFLPFS